VRLPIRAIGQGLLWFCAANFAGLVVLLAVLALLGAVEPARWSQAVSVLRGASEAVASAELARLRGLEREEAERRGTSEELLVESWRALRERERRFEERASEQRARLELLAAHVDAERRRLDLAAQTWRQEREEAERQRLRREEELRAAASAKVQRLYRYMRPETVAQDLEARMTQGRPEEVAEIVKVLPERTAAEVLEAFGDPGRRNRVYELLAGRPVQAPGTGR